MNTAGLFRRSVQWPNDTFLAVGLALLSIVSRLPFRSQIMYHWDCINFAMALQEFNLAKDQPHPPGYILYVYLGRLVNSIVPDRAVALTLISIVSGALAVVALFYLGRAIFNRKVGLIGALLLASCPLFWFYGEISLPHPLDAFLIILSAWWLYRAVSGDHRYVIPVATLLAIAGGFRQQTLVMMAPLALFAVRKVKPGRLALAVLVGGITCAGWFIPLVQSQGGLKTYLEISKAFSDRSMNTTSVLHGGGWWGIRRNLIKLGMYTLYAWNLSLIPGLLYIGLRLWHRSRSWNWEKVVFFLLWVVPFSGFYAFVHVGQQGHVFVFLPALCLISAAGLVRFLTTRPRWLMAATAVLVALNAGIFCLVPEYPLGPGTQRLLTRATLVNSDRYYQDRFRAIEESFAPASTAILAANWHHVEYYLPEYMRLPFGVVGKWEKDAGNPRGSPHEVVATPTGLGLQLDGRGQVAIIVFDPALMAFSESPSSAHELSLKHGGSLEYFVLTRGQAFHYGTSSFGIREN
ncbi:MAG: glycosyltransferase family 39 protein [Anaerolineae bacterium]|nr:glycosyltransferase family 39 protein [Anaerolineae bacterium]